MASAPAAAGTARQAAAVMPEQQRRHDLIEAIEQSRGSRVIAYTLSDRQGLQAQIAEDSVRPMYDHLRAIGPLPKIDLFLYSVGGLIDVPWRIVSMLREFGEKFSVLIPYKAMSAATMIAIGADEIVMGSKGELGPIDPQMSIQRGGAGGTVVQEQIAVEDIYSYISFLKETVGLTEQNALAGPVGAIAQKMEPWILGQVNRAHSHIRVVAEKLLASRHAEHAIEPEQVKTIIDTLAEKTFQHGHAIGRNEAATMGLNIVRPDAQLEPLMWELFECYEVLFALRSPIDPRTFIPPGQDEHVMPVTMGAMESRSMAFQFTADMKGRIQRQAAQLNLNLNFNLQLPPTMNVNALPAQLQQALQQLLQQVQQQSPALIQQEIQHQMPPTGIEIWVQDGVWNRRQEWPAS